MSYQTGIRTSILNAMLLMVFQAITSTNTYASLIEATDYLKVEFAQQWDYAYAMSGQVMRRAGLSETGIVRLIVAFLLFAILFPIAMAQVTSATTTAWNPAVATVFAVLTPILVVLAAALAFFAVVESRGGV